MWGTALQAAPAVIGAIGSMRGGGGGGGGGSPPATFLPQMGGSRPAPAFAPQPPPGPAPMDVPPKSAAFVTPIQDIIAQISRPGARGPPPSRPPPFTARDSLNY